MEANARDDYYSPPTSDDDLMSPRYMDDEESDYYEDEGLGYHSGNTETRYLASETDFDTDLDALRASQQRNASQMKSVGLSSEEEQLDPSVYNSNIPPRRKPPGKPPTKTVLKRAQSLSTIHRERPISAPPIPPTNREEIIDLGSAGVPQGFSFSVLAPLATTGPNKLSSFLLPRLDSTGLSYLDLFEDSQSQSQPNPCFTITFKSAINIPTPGPSYEVGSKRVRVCLFDTSDPGDPFKSNVHTITSPKPSETARWTFPSRRGVWMVRDNEDKVLVRYPTEMKSKSLKLLFELCLVVKRNSTDGRFQVGELCCGRYDLDLFNLGTEPHVNFGMKKMSLYSQAAGAGTKTDPRKAMKGMPTLIVELGPISKNRTLSAPTATARTLFQIQKNLPNTVIISHSMVPLVSLFRHCLSDSLQNTLCVSSVIHCEPELCTFLHLINNTDLQEAFLALWLTKEKGFTSKQKSVVNGQIDPHQKWVFRKTCLQLWGLLELTDIPRNLVFDQDALITRHKMLDDFIRPAPGELPETHFLSNPRNYRFRPFRIEEVMFDPLPSQPPHVHPKAPPLVYFSPWKSTGPA